MNHSLSIGCTYNHFECRTKEEKFGAAAAADMHR